VVEFKEESQTADPELRLELYKNLRAEAASYVEKVPALWLQKFVLVGSVIAFILVHDGQLTGSGGLLVAAISAIPILAILLDAKIAEYGLHARVVSKFLGARFGDSVAKEWESTLWGDHGDKKIISLVKLRSLMTAIVTTSPTVILIIVAGLAIDVVRGHGSPLVVYLSVAVAILYIVGGVFIWRIVWPRRST
jgi:hypothetical protein